MAIMDRILRMSDNERAMEDNFYQDYNTASHIKTKYRNINKDGFGNVNRPLSTEEYFDVKYKDIGGLEELRKARAINNPNYVQDADAAFTNLNKKVIEGYIDEPRSFFERLMGLNTLTSEQIDYFSPELYVAGSKRGLDQRKFEVPMRLQNNGNDLGVGQYSPDDNLITASMPNDEVNTKDIIAHEYSHALQDASNTIDQSWMDWRKLDRLENRDFILGGETEDIPKRDISKTTSKRLGNFDSYAVSPIEIEASLSGDVNRWMRETNSQGVVTDQDAGKFLDWLRLGSNREDKDIQIYKMHPQFFNQMLKHPDQAKKLLQGIVSNEDGRKQGNYA